MLIKKIAPEGTFQGLCVFKTCIHEYLYYRLYCSSELALVFFPKVPTLLFF
jgi:hypothetical protein